MENFFNPIRYFMSYYSYGGGLMWNQSPLIHEDDNADWKQSTMIGHGGMDYAS